MNYFEDYRKGVLDGLEVEYETEDLRNFELFRNKVADGLNIEYEKPEFRSHIVYRRKVLDDLGVSYENEDIVYGKRWRAKVLGGLGIDYEEEDIINEDRWHDKVLEKFGTVWKTVSGAIASFDDAEEAPMKSVVAQIEPIQEGIGDPSPTNVRPISGWSGVEVNRTGKNLFPAEINIDDSQYTHRYEVGEFPWVREFAQTLKKLIGKNVVWSCKTTGSASGAAIGQFRLYDANGNYFMSNPNSPIVVPNTVDYDNIYQVIMYGSTTGATVTDCQLELGTTATAYEPYQGTSYSIPFKDSDDNPITVYGGEIDVVSGEGEDEIGITKLKDLNWVYQEASNRFYTPSLANVILKPSTAGDIPQGLACECYKPTNQNSLGSSDLALIIGTSGNAFIKDSNYTDVASFLADMGEYKIVYPLATPTPIYCEPTEIKTLKGNNNVWADTGEVEVTYKAKKGGGN